MAGWLNRIRRAVYPRSGFPERGNGKPPRASDLILATVAVIAVVVIAALAVTELSRAI